MDFGKLLLEYRLKRDMSMRDLAARVDLDNSYISRLERGIKVNPSREIVKRLAEALDAPTDEFLLAAGYAPDDLRIAASKDSPWTEEQLRQIIREVIKEQRRTE